SSGPRLARISLPEDHHRPLPVRARGSLPRRAARPPRWAETGFCSIACKRSAKQDKGMRRAGRGNIPFPSRSLRAPGKALAGPGERGGRNGDRTNSPACQEELECAVSVPKAMIKTYFLYRSLQARLPETLLRFKTPSSDWATDPVNNPTRLASILTGI